MENYYSFLMEELKEITEEFDSPSQIAHEVCLLLSVDGLPIPETFFKLYTANLAIEPSILYNAAAYFSGAGFLNIACDCNDSDKSLCEYSDIHQNPFFTKGMEENFSQQECWQHIDIAVNNIREHIICDN